jgi:SAM-dependent methyltransferase
MTKYTDANRRLWDEWTRVHEGSDFYDLESFKIGEEKRHSFDAAPGVRIRDYELEEIGEVAGRDLLHLQCHFGIDSLSWARLGARVTGIDFSEAAVALAQSLATELGLDARFLVSSVQELSETLIGDFDIVYTSRGAIWWLGDLQSWARTVEHFLRPGGVFYITEFHPILQTLDDSADLLEPRVRYPYFPKTEPLSYPVSGSYADHTAEIDADTEYGWPHSIAEVVTAIASSGLRIEFLHEFEWVDHRYITLLEESDDGRWRLPGGAELPLMYSLRARKPE